MIMKALIATLSVVTLIATDPVLACGGSYSHSYVHRTAPAVRNANAVQKIDKIDTLPHVSGSLAPAQPDHNGTAKTGSPLCKKYFPSVGEMIPTPCSG
jgi:hypothetical protein